MGKLSEETIVVPKARNTWIIARRKHIEEKTQGGIFLPHQVREGIQKETGVGVVESVGDGANPHNGGTPGTPPCKVGDVIVWSTYAERVVISDDESDVVAIPFKELIGVLESEIPDVMPEDVK